MGDAERVMDPWAVYGPIPTPIAPISLSGPDPRPMHSVILSHSRDAAKDLAIQRLYSSARARYQYFISPFPQDCLLILPRVKPAC